MLAIAPGYRTNPRHHIVETFVTQPIAVAMGDVVLANSKDVVRVDEDGCPARYYFLRADVRMDLLERTPTVSRSALRACVPRTGWGSRRTAPASAATTAVYSPCCGGRSDRDAERHRQRQRPTTPTTIPASTSGRRYAGSYPLEKVLPQRRRDRYRSPAHGAPCRRVIESEESVGDDEGRARVHEGAAASLCIASVRQHPLSNERTRPRMAQKRGERHTRQRLRRSSGSKRHDV
jgi:hypothetical protein